MKHTLLTVIGKDRPGIISTVTGVLYDHGANLEDVSMTILEGQFSMMLILAAKRKDDFKRDLQKLEKKLKLSLFWQDLKGKPKRGSNHAKNSKSYIITVFGKDRTGIVHQTSKILAGKKLNITNLQSNILGVGKKAIYAMLIEVDIPRKFKIHLLRTSLRVLAKKLKVDIQLKAAETISL